jgi:DNA/RNA endonuclease G (NUC1)
MSKKNTSSSIWRRIAQFLMLALATGLVGANWFVHEPRAWREKQTASWPAPVAQTVENLGNAFADYTDALGLSGSDVSVDLPVFTPPNGFTFGGHPVPIPGGVARTDVVILQKQTFTLGWSPSLRHAVWAAYRVSPTRTPLDLMRPSSFSQDTTARNAPRSADYARSGYDRGHLVPNHAIASRFGKKAQAETFLTSNIAPQRPALNQGPWADVELRIADNWPDRFGDVWVIVGTISPPQRQTLAADINIPTAFYQIVVTRHADRVRAFADGVSEFRGAEELRHKETDRLAAVASMLKTAGVKVDELPDGLRIHGRPDFVPSAGTFETWHDHRIAMSSGILAGRAPGLSTIRHSECTAISYPRFWDDFTAVSD